MSSVVNPLSMFRPVGNPRVHELLNDVSSPLTALMDQDSFQTEFRNSDNAALNHYMDYNRYRQLLYFIIDEGDPTNRDRAYKYPFVASEILAIDNSNTEHYLLAHQPQVMLEHWLFIQTESPQKKSGKDVNVDDFAEVPPEGQSSASLTKTLRMARPLVYEILDFFSNHQPQPTITAYLCKVLTVFIKKQPILCLTALFNKTETLMVMFAHLSSSRSLAELLFSTMTVEPSYFVEERIFIVERLVNAVRQIFAKSESFNSYESILNCLLGFRNSTSILKLQRIQNLADIRQLNSDQQLFLTDVSAFLSQYFQKLAQPQEQNATTQGGQSEFSVYRQEFSNKELIKVMAFNIKALRNDRIGFKCSIEILRAFLEVFVLLRSESLTSAKQSEAVFDQVVQIACNKVFGAGQPETVRSHTDNKSKLSVSILEQDVKVAQSIIYSASQGPYLPNVSLLCECLHLFELTIRHNISICSRILADSEYFLPALYCYLAELYPYSTILHNRFKVFVLATVESFTEFNYTHVTLTNALLETLPEFITSLDKLQRPPSFRLQLCELHQKISAIQTEDTIPLTSSVKWKQVGLNFVADNQRKCKQLLGGYEKRPLKPVLFTNREDVFNHFSIFLSGVEYTDLDDFLNIESNSDASDNEDNDINNNKPIQQAPPDERDEEFNAIHSNS